MDYTLLGVDGSLRPLAREILQRLVDDGHQLYIWSGNGIRWRDIRKHDLQSLVIDSIEKPVSYYVNAAAIMNVKPDLLVVSVVESTHLQAVALLEAVKDAEIPSIVGGVLRFDFIPSSTRRSALPTINNRSSSLASTQRIT